MKDATGGTQKTLAGLDDIAHQAGRVNFKSWRNVLCTVLPADSAALKDAVSLVNKVEHFLEFDYKKSHLEKTSRIAAHCINHAFFLSAAKSPLSKFSSRQCGDECQGHDMFCKDCDEIETIRAFLEKALLDFSERNIPETVEDVQCLVSRCIHKLDVLIGHLVRVRHEYLYFKDAVANLPLDTAIIQCDHKMKVEQLSYREPQASFYGKKGTTLVGCLVMYKDEDDQRDYSSKMFFATSSDQTQDCFSTLAYLEQILKAFATEVPHVTKFKFFSDGAGTFAGAFTRVLIPRLFASYGCELLEAITGEAGDGKSLVDSLFSTVTPALNAYVTRMQGFGDIIGSESLATALRATMGDKVVVLHVVVDRSKECGGFLTKIFQGYFESVSSAQYNTFEYDEDGIIVGFSTVLRQHSGVGLGLTYSQAELDLGWVAEIQKFPLSSLVATPISDSNHAVNPKAPKSIFTSIPTEDSKKLAEQELASKRLHVQEKKCDKLKLAAKIRIELALKKGTNFPCPEPKCTRMFISSRYLLDHCEKGNHSDGKNSFRVKSGIRLRSTLSLRDCGKQCTISFLDGSDCSLITRQPHHLANGSTRQTVPNEHNLLTDIEGPAHFVPDAGFGRQLTEPHARREYAVIAYLYLVYQHGNENKLFLTTADQASADMPLFGTFEGEKKHAGHPLWKANVDGRSTFRVRQLLTVAIIKGYFSKKPEDFKKQYERAKKKHEEGLKHLIVPSSHPVIPQLQPLAAMQEPNQSVQELAGSAEADSDLSDSDLDDDNNVAEISALMANSAANAFEQTLDTGNSDGHDATVHDMFTLMDDSTARALKRKELVRMALPASTPVNGIIIHPCLAPLAR